MLARQMTKLETLKISVREADCHSSLQPEPLPVYLGKDNSVSWKELDKEISLRLLSGSMNVHANHLSAENKFLRCMLTIEKLVCVRRCVRVGRYTYSERVVFGVLQKQGEFSSNQLVTNAVLPSFRITLSSARSLTLSLPQKVTHVTRK